MHLIKAPDESLNDFHDCFIHFRYEFSEEDVDSNFIKEKFNFFVNILMNPKQYESFESIPTYLGYGAPKLETKEVVFASDSSSSSH